jgi:hypothetical protein
VGVLNWEALVDNNHAKAGMEDIVGGAFDITLQPHTTTPTVTHPPTPTFITIPTPSHTLVSLAALAIGNMKQHVQ